MLALCYLKETHAKRKNRALAGVAQWIERWPANQGVAGLIPSQGTCLGCGPGLQVSCQVGAGTHSPAAWYIAVFIIQGWVSAIKLPREALSVPATGFQEPGPSPCMSH